MKKDRQSQRIKQQSLFKPQELSFGGNRRNLKKHRQARSLSTKESMHLVLKSSKARHDWSFRRTRNAQVIQQIVSRFSTKYGVRILSLANVGNHLHFHMQLSNRHAYKKWIRAITGAIAIKISGVSRWIGGKNDESERFWDYRPFTRVVRGFRAFLTMRDYVLINKLEGIGVERATARQVVSASVRMMIKNQVLMDNSS